MIKSLKFISALLLGAALISCNGNEPDAHGVFEFPSVNIGAENSGKILAFHVGEGDKVVRGQELALIDTVTLAVQKDNLEAARKAAAMVQSDADVQTAALQQKIAKLKEDLQTTKRLVASGAAPRKQQENLEAEISVLESQVKATRATINNTNTATAGNVESLDAQIKGVVTLMEKCHILAPTDGVITAKYASDGEIAVAGRALVKVADTGSAFLRAYFTSSQLRDVTVGQKVRVIANYGKDSTREYEGTVVWISDESEFTPKTILTDDERSNLVYEAKITVENDGYLKAGISGEVYLK
ncbi:MAG: HlyD family efflux transporter periplasmic adaptor subunit [Prevotella sp.]|nr:HlyD family efflux transporter periplasmic adaptor subunit [Candidatus Equicola faecalis]